VIGATLNDPDEAAWHLACAASEADETLAQRVEQAVQDVGDRGAAVRVTKPYPCR